MMIAAIQTMVDTRKFSEMFPALWQTMGFKLCSTNTLSNARLCGQPRRILEAPLMESRQLRVEHTRGSTSTTRKGNSARAKLSCHHLHCLLPRSFSFSCDDRSVSASQLRIPRHLLLLSTAAKIWEFSLP